MDKQKRTHVQLLLGRFKHSLQLQSYLTEAQQKQLRQLSQTTHHTERQGESPALREKQNGNKGRESKNFFPFFYFFSKKPLTIQNDLLY
tara:strand:- start:238 stop:504 length:267 start_codon:yes stop_codon:yes gene_type:complete